MNWGPALPQADRLTLPGFHIDLARGELRTAEGNHVDLRPRSFAVLRLLASNAGRLVTKDEIMNVVWDDAIVTEDSLTQCIADIRNALGDTERRFVRTVPRRGYVLAAFPPAGPAPGVASIRPAARRRSPTGLDRGPSIQQFQRRHRPGLSCDGFAEDLISELSRFRELRVIARNLSFRYRGRAVDVRDIGRDLGVAYILEGSMQRSGERIRITAQLIDTATGIHHWAERYDRNLEDVFAVQDEVTWTIVTTLAVQVNQAERERARGKAPSAWQAYDYYLKAGEAYASYYATLDVERAYEARRLLEHALAVDPHFARAYSRLAVVHLTMWHNGRPGDFGNPALIERARELALKAVELDPTSPHAHADLGFILTYRRDYDAAGAAFEQATALNPSFSDWRFIALLVFAGEFERALRVADRHKRADPFYPPPNMAFSGLAQHMLGRYVEAEALLREHLSRQPNNRPALVWLAATYARMGRLEEAQAAAAHILRLAPGYTIDGAARQFIAFKHSEHAERVFEALVMAGISGKIERIPIVLMSPMGESLQVRRTPKTAQCPLRSESDRNCCVAANGLRGGPSVRFFSVISPTGAVAYFSLTGKTVIS